MSEQHVPTIHAIPPDSVASTPPDADARGEACPACPGLTRRGFLRVSAVTGVGVAAAAVAACTPGGAAAWTYPPSAASPIPSGAAPATSPAASAAASASPMASHDAGASPSAGAIERAGRRHPAGLVRA